MPGTLTPEQSTERDAYRIDNPNRVDDDIVTEATVNGPPDEDGWQTWTITGEQGWTFGQFRLPPDMDAPAPGDTFTTYGGFGFPVIGGDLRGEPCWFKTAAEVQAERDAWLAEQGEKKRRAYEENKGEIQATYEALDPDLKVRIDRFVANCPEDWWVEFGGYEMFALDVATKIATAARQSDDPQEAVRYYSELPYGEQTALVPDAEIGQMSGNQFGYSVSVAYWLVAEPSKDRALFLRWGHGAMVPLTGCESYGCKPPTEEELHALSVEFGEEPEVPEEEPSDPRWDALRALAHHVRENTHVIHPDEADRYDSDDVIDTHFIKVLIRHDAQREDFVKVLEAVMEHGGEFCEIPKERFAQGPSYIEIGAWCGDQTLALRMMALGARVGVWDVITPAILGITGPDADDLAGRGMVLVSGYHPEGKIPTITLGIERGPFASDEDHQEALRSSKEATETGRQIVASGETSDEIDITGLDPAAVLAALYNASKPIGMGVLQARDGDMTVAEAQVLLAQTNNFDYLYGRPIKVTIPTDTSEPGTIINPRNYDCNFGIGTAAAAIDAIREG